MAVIFVIDASAAVKAFVQEENSDQARRFLAGPFVLVAPGHALGECAEVLVRKVATLQLQPLQAKEAITAISKSIGFIALDDLIEVAMDIAIGAGVSVCDALYIAAARSLGCRLVTADTRLIRKIGTTGDAKLLIPLGEAAA